jgi:hypothetical protein
VPPRLDAYSSRAGDGANIWVLLDWILLDAARLICLDLGEICEVGGPCAGLWQRADLDWG